MYHPVLFMKQIFCWAHTGIGDKVEETKQINRQTKHAGLTEQVGFLDAERRKSLTEKMPLGLKYEGKKISHVAVKEKNILDSGKRQGKVLHAGGLVCLKNTEEAQGPEGRGIWGWQTLWSMVWALTFTLSHKGSHLIVLSRDMKCSGLKRSWDGARTEQGNQLGAQYSNPGRGTGGDLDVTRAVSWSEVLMRPIRFSDWLEVVYKNRWGVQRMMSYVWLLHLEGWVSMSQVPWGRCGRGEVWTHKFENI